MANLWIFLCRTVRCPTKFDLYLDVCSSSESNVRPIWDVFVRQIWPIFTTTNVHHLGFDHADHLNNMLRFISPTILFDNNINSIQSAGRLFPEAIDDDAGPNATPPTAGHALSKWLHTPRTDGQPKKLRCINSLYQQPNHEWINSFKETFLHATSSVSYKVNLTLASSTPIDLFELENKRTNEKLTMEKVPSWHHCNWLLKRCPIEETAAVQWEEGNLTNVRFMINIDYALGHCRLQRKKKKMVKATKKYCRRLPGPVDQQRNE